MTGFVLSLLIMSAVALAAYLAASAYYRRAAQPVTVRLSAGVMPDGFMDWNNLTLKLSVRVGNQWRTGIYDRRVVASAGA